MIFQSLVFGKIDDEARIHRKHRYLKDKQNNHINYNDDKNKVKKLRTNSAAVDFFLPFIRR